ncbi:hypothetical protein [Streptomyces sp. NPDC014006]|uniref:hypothetical protein n=1 Tax=Streptomyces sp. NPDC014006 TaxID=3364870 RepID=UPI0036F722AE
MQGTQTPDPYAILHGWLAGSYVRPDGGPLTDADFEHLARIARAATARKGD